jgi:hypothetical protein
MIFNFPLIGYNFLLGVEANEKWITEGKIDENLMRLTNARIIQTVNECFAIFQRNFKPCLKFQLCLVMTTFGRKLHLTKQ